MDEALVEIAQCDWEEGIRKGAWWKGHNARMQDCDVLYHENGTESH